MWCEFRFKHTVWTDKLVHNTVWHYIHIFFFFCQFLLHTANYVTFWICVNAKKALTYHVPHVVKKSKFPVFHLFFPNWQLLTSRWCLHHRILTTVSSHTKRQSERLVLRIVTWKKITFMWKEVGKFGLQQRMQQPCHMRAERQIETVAGRTKRDRWIKKRDSTGVCRKKISTAQHCLPSAHSDRSPNQLPQATLHLSFCSVTGQHHIASAVTFSTY